MAAEEHDELLDGWLDRWEEAKEQDETLTPEELCRDRPELLPDLKRRIRELERLDEFLDSAQDAAAASGPFVEIQAGRYRAKRLHAPGGLGEVFYADDDELNREVALKRLRPSIAWSREARRRFLLEAEVTGRLEHPGVVPVYGLGKDQHGNPYYAMRFIRGKTLDEAAEALPATWDNDPDKYLQGLKGLLHALKTACQTIAYAHDHGVLHRDLKPGNIILGDYGEVLVIDWGLAKTLDTAGDAVTKNERFQADSKPASRSNTADRDDTASFRLDATEEGQIKGTPRT
jgi:eukaryotic-like serine/threonine-protein kinase